MAKAKLTLLRRKWLKAYFDGVDQTQAARNAGYKAKTDESFRAIGHENFVLLHDHIVKWLDEEGLSEAALKQRLVSGLDVKKTKFFPYRTKDDKGNEIQIIDEVEVSATSEQRRYLDMSLKVKGLYAPEKHDIESDLTVIINKFGKEPDGSKPTE